MDFEFYMEYGDALASQLIGITSSVALIGLALSIVAYVFSSLGLYQISKRRGIAGAGWAWVPLGNLWILGSIADQYDFTVKDVRHKQRHLLLWLYIILLLLYIAMFILLFAIGFQAVEHLYDDALASQLIGLAFIVIILCIVMVAVAVLSLVFLYIAYYKLYKSCMPGNATLFLVLSIFFSFLIPFFVFACRKKDDGMVPPPPPPTYQYYAPPYGTQPPHFGNTTP